MSENQLNRMETMAAHCIEEILDQIPSGPSALADYSLGGYVAYEMARQRAAVGKEIKRLAMFGYAGVAPDQAGPVAIARPTIRRWRSYCNTGWIVLKWAFKQIITHIRHLAV